MGIISVDFDISVHIFCTCQTLEGKKHCTALFIDFQGH